MSYKISEIEGIGPTYASKLDVVGIKTTDDLLTKGATNKSRKDLEVQTGISSSYILKWVNMADLFRISGIASQTSELLEAAGVDTVKELRNRVAANLHAKMAEVNTVKNLVNRMPSLLQVEKFIEEAKSLEPKVTY